MKVVARRTGLSPHLIRIWERRYGAVTPARTNGNRRLYGESEISRLLMLHAATRAGHSIGQIARLSEEELRGLLNQAPPGEVSLNGHVVAPPAGENPGHRDPVADAMASIRNLDTHGLEAVLDHAATALGQVGLLQRVLVPLIHQIGEAWREGMLKVAHEHVASTVIRTCLGSFARAGLAPHAAPRLIVTTPTGQWHELGAMLVAVSASHLGWNVTYLGPGLPAEEIAGAAIQQRARAVALSLVYPEDDPLLDSELIRLRKLLPAPVAILAGGRAAPAYRNLLQRIKAIQLDTLAALPTALDQLRKVGKSAPLAARATPS